MKAASKLIHDPIERLKTILSVALITALIWLFAESESLTQTSIDAPVRLIAPAGSERVVRIADTAWTGSVQIQLQGSRSVIERAPRQLGAGVELLLGAPGVPGAAGEHTIDLREALRLNPPLDRVGATIVGIEPSSVRVEIERLVRRTDVPVRLELDRLDIDIQHELQPSVVSVMLPESLSERLGDRIGVVARLDPDDLDRLTEDERHTMTATLSLAGAMRDQRLITISPSTVDVSLVVRSRADRITLASVPVHLQLLPMDANEWRVTVHDQFLTDVTVVGPVDIIERIRTNQLPVIALLSLSTDELERRITEKRATFRLLPDELRFEGGDRPVRITIEPRRPAETP